MSNFKQLRARTKSNNKCRTTATGGDDALTFRVR